MFFPHSGGAWGSGDILRRHQEKIAYRARLKRPQSDLCEAKGSCLLDRRHLVSVINTYSPFVPLLWDNHHVGQLFRVLNCSNKFVLQKIIDLGLDDQVAIWMKAPHFLSDRLGGWGDI